MVNRTIQQKDRKRKMRGKHRKHSKQFINTGSGPPPGAVSALYRHKLIDDHVDQYLASKFPQRYFYSDDKLIEHNELENARVAILNKRNAEEIEKGNALPEKANTFPLGEVRLLMRNLQEQMNATIMENHFKLYNRSWHKIDLFFNATKTCWMMIEMKTLGGENFVRRSCIYSSKPLAIQALRLSAVEWVETVLLLQA